VSCACGADDAPNVAAKAQHLGTTGLAREVSMSTTTGNRPAVEHAEVMARDHAAAYPLSWLLAAVTVAGTLPTILLPDVLHGPAAMNGSARGTALVMLLGGVPLLVGSMLAARRGSTRGVVLWLGALAYLAYNGVMLLIGTPFNALFLLYDAILGLSIWAAITLLHRVDVDAVAAQFGPGLRVRSVAVLMWVIVVLNTLVWLRGLLPGLTAGASPAFLEGTGLTTFPTYVQDFAFWLPLFTVAAWWLWHRQPWGLMLAPALMAYFVLEAVGVAVDQAWGHAADPASTVVSLDLVPGFAVLAVLCAVVLAHLLRQLDPSHSSMPKERS
jgi:hypothetical protein